MTPPIFFFFIPWLDMKLFVCARGLFCFDWIHRRWNGFSAQHEYQHLTDFEQLIQQQQRNGIHKKHHTMITHLVNICIFHCMSIQTNASHTFDFDGSWKIYSRLAFVALRGIYAVLVKSQIWKWKWTNEHCYLSGAFG